MTHDEKRFFRREAINSHLWVLGWEYREYGWMRLGQLENIKLIVRLYERQFYGGELKAYA